MTARNFEIKETMLALPQKSETDIYHIELNRISWFGKEDKLDIRGGQRPFKNDKRNQPHRG